MDSIELQGPIVDIDIIKQYPDISNTTRKRADLSTYLDSLISASSVPKDGLSARWRIIEDDYELKSSGSNLMLPTLDMPSVPMPFTTPRVNQLVTQITNAISKSAPYMVCQTNISDEERALLEKIVFNKMKEANFEAALNKAALQAALFNYGVLWVDFQTLARESSINEDYVEELNESKHLKYSGIVIKSIDINDIFVYPSTSETFQTASFVARRFWLTLDVIHELQLSGKYYKTTDDYDLQSGSPITEDILHRYAASRQSEEGYLDSPESTLVEIWEIYCKYSKKGKSSKWYRVHYAKSSSFVLECEEWNEPCIPFFLCGILTRRISFWDRTSFAGQLISLQSQYNNVNDAIYANAFMTSCPPLACPGAMLPEKFTQYRPGEIIPLNMDLAGANMKPEFLQVQPQVGELLQYVNALDQKGDELSNLGANNIGVPEEKSSISATQSSIINQTAEAGLSKALNEFTLDFPRMTNYICYLLGKYYPMWNGFEILCDQNDEKLKEWYSQQAMSQTQDEESRPPSIRDLLYKCRDWDVNGKNINSSMLSNLTYIQQLWQMASSDSSIGINKQELVKMLIGMSNLSGGDKILSTISPTTPVPGNPTQMMPQNQLEALQQGQGSQGQPPQSAPNVTPQPGAGGIPLPPLEQTNIRPPEGINPQKGIPKVG